MKLPLLSTKTYPPPVPEYEVQRPRLEQRLDGALHGHHKLILVSAAPGSGKSSLVAAWAVHLTALLAWVTLDEGDNDPTLFWSYVLLAIQQHVSIATQGMLEQMLVDLNTTPVIPPAFLPDLINLLSSQLESLVVVLDDYHAIERQEIHQGILYLLEHIPAQVCLAITTRIDPPLPLHRWRARGQLTEIRAADLRFTQAEASDFLVHRMGLELNPADIQKLEDRTEGWATGLQLAALSMQGRSDYQAFIERFTGSQHFVLEYLMNEVLARQSEEIQRFLLSNSILDSFCAPLCAQILQAAGSKIKGEGVQEAASILTSLERSNLFLIPLDEEHNWFRFHRLFGDFLNQRLKHQGEELVRRLHQRAAEWYNDHSKVDEALQHALAAENIPFAFAIIRRHSMQAASEGRTRAVVRWLETLPKGQLAEDGQLSLLYAWMLMAIGKTNSLEPHIQNAGRALLSGKTIDLDPETRRSLLGQLATLRAMQAARVGDQAATEKLVEEARNYSSPEDAPVLGLAWLAQANLQRELGNIEQSISAYQESLPRLPSSGVLSGTWMMVSAFGQAYEVQGQLQAAEDLFRSRIALAVESGQEHVPAIGILQIELAGIEYEKNRLAEARALFAKGEAHSQRSGMFDLLTSTALLGARLDRLEGRLADGIQRLQVAHQAVRRGDSPNLTAQIRAWLARWQAEAGNLGEAESWAKRIQPQLDHNPGYTHGIELFTLLRIFILHDHLEEALNLAIRLETLANEGRSLARTIEAFILEAEILWRQSRQVESFERLAASLRQAEPLGFARLFLDEGNRLSPVFTAWQSSGQQPESLKGYATWLLQCFRQEASPALPGGEASLSELALLEQGITALTGRELDVFRLLIQGLSYPEIARRLVVSPGTVKTHASHIYSKLGVRGRVEAIQRAKELKIV